MTLALLAMVLGTLGAAWGAEPTPPQAQEEVALPAVVYPYGARGQVGLTVTGGFSRARDARSRGCSAPKDVMRVEMRV